MEFGAETRRRGRFCAFAFGRGSPEALVPGIAVGGGAAFIPAFAGMTIGDEGAIQYQAPTNLG